MVPRWISPNATCHKTRLYLFIKNCSSKQLHTWHSTSLGSEHYTCWISISNGKWLHIYSAFIWGSVSFAHFPIRSMGSCEERSLSYMAIKFVWEVAHRRFSSWTLFWPFFHPFSPQSRYVHQFLLMRNIIYHDEAKTTLQTRSVANFAILTPVKLCTYRPLSILAWSDKNYCITTSKNVVSGSSAAQLATIPSL